MGHLRALNRALVRTGRVEVLQTFLVGESQVEALEAGGRAARTDGRWFEARTGIPIFPCLVPMRTPGRTDMDSTEACNALRRHLAQLLQQERPGLLHVHLVRHRIQIVALEAAQEAGIPTVITHHEGQPATPEMAEILREAYRLSDRICAVTRFSAAAFGDPPSTIEDSSWTATSGIRTPSPDHERESGGDGWRRERWIGFWCTPRGSFPGRTTSF